MKFVGRDDELKILEEQYASDSSFIIIKGRRRVGKSRLIEEFLKDKEHLYFEVDHETSASILSSLSHEISGDIEMRFESWSDALRYYASRTDGKKVIAIDEFPYAISADKGLIKEFQALWDRYLSRMNVMLILCGSSLTSMNGLTGDYRSPLYGRNTCDLTVLPFTFRQSLMDENYRTAVEKYAITGGIPHYISLLGKKEPIDGAIAVTMMPGAPLLNEGEYLLGSEFNNLSSYNTYLKTIANGNRTLRRITSATQSPSNDVLPYIRRLIDTGMVTRIVPITERNPENSRNGQYLISDHFLAMWFHFVYPYRNQISRMENEVAIQNLRDHLVEAHVAFVFEDVCREELRRYLLSNGIYAEYGKYWGKGVIDLIALDRKNDMAYVAECKFVSRPVGLTVLNSLRKKTSAVKELDDYDITYCLFSVSGYDEDMIDGCGDDVLLFNDGEPVSPSQVVEDINDESDEGPIS